MQTIELEILPEKTAFRGQNVILVLSARGSLPKQVRMRFQPETASSTVELDHFRSSAENQLVIDIERKPGTLLLTGQDGSVLGRLEIGPGDVHSSERTVPSASASVPPGGGAPPGDGAEGPDLSKDTVQRRVVRLERTDAKPVRGQHLWSAIRRGADGLSYPRFARFVELAFGHHSEPCDERERAVKAALEQHAGALHGSGPSFFRIDSYERLKAVAEVFVLANAEVVPSLSLVSDEIGDMKDYMENDRTLPYLRLIYDRLGVRPPRLLDTTTMQHKAEAQVEYFELKSRQPCLIELIWSYWHEEAMQVQAMAAITQRFQNRRAPGERDPLAQLEIDPLRGLNHLLWGHAQSESERLSVLRRAHEYEAEYGFPLHGKAVAALRPADRRSKFLEAFHNLLYRCVQFYREDDNTTHVADGFPILNALKETHYVLSQGSHNQFGDLPATSRQEMLIEQWLLARPEMREFLGGRPMVAYPEPWMDRVDMVKTLKGWNDVSVVHFHDLAVFGEQLLLSIRWDSWSTQSDPDTGKQWARDWRPHVQGYIHALRAVLGIDLGAEITNARDEAERYLPPSVHLRRRLGTQAAR